MATATEEKSSSEPKSYRWIWWVIALIVIVVAGLWFTGNLAFTVQGSGSYQAVFLTNDQVYFGKLSRSDSQYPVLREVFYLQVTQVLQPSNTANPGTNVNLVKLGGELHGPEDAMFLNRDQILFYEDLKSDSQVVKAIRDYQESQAK
ncbi:MAG: hypothetical protein AAB518_02615 [Patescibacteria group bacterium]